MKGINTFMAVILYSRDNFLICLFFSFYINEKKQICQVFNTADVPYCGCIFVVQNPMIK